MPVPAAGSTADRDVILCECFARDGLQHESDILPTPTKRRLIERAAAIGFPRIEATSYARPDVIPQFRDGSELLASLTRHAGVSYKATCPNVRAVERAAMDAATGHGADEISVLVSASESHSRRNLQRSRDEQWRNVTAMASAAQGQFGLIGTISVAFGCPFEGAVAPAVVMDDVRRFVACGVTDVALGDTVGMASPRAVRALFTQIAAEYPMVTAIAHFHDTRGTAMVNALAALEAGVRSFDSAFGGAGGHPVGIKYGDGHTGNLCTEDWVCLLESMGVRTGIDLGQLLSVAKACEAALGRELAGRVTRSGLSPMLQSLVDAGRAS